MVLRIGFVATCGRDDSRYWSGTVYHMRQALEIAGADVTHLGPLLDPFAKRNALLRAASEMLGGGRKLYDRNENTLMGYANQLNARNLDKRFDVLISPSTLPLSKYHGDLPKYIWIDASFGSMINFYPEFTSLSDSCIARAQSLEMEALHSANMVIFASQWARRDAVQIYNLNAGRTAVIPFGANIVSPPSAEFVRRSIAEKSRSRCVLLFIGVDWGRKGGAVALAVAEHLIAAGIDTVLHIVGSQVPPKLRRPYVVEHGYLDKSSPGGYSHLTELFMQSHFFILPTKAECFGIALAEASAFGVPSLAYDVGGVGSAISNDYSGKLFSPSDGSAAFAEFIENKYTDWESYTEMATHAREYYLTTTNWTTAGGAALDLLSRAAQVL